MRRLILTLLLGLLLCPLAQAQRADSLQARLDSLLQARTALQTKLTWVEMDIAEVEGKLDRIAFEKLSAEGVEIEMRQAGVLRPDPDPESVLTTIPAGTVLKASGYSRGYWHVFYEGRVGYVSDAYVLQTEPIKRFVDTVEREEGAADLARPGAQPRPKPAPRSSPCCKICRTGKACGNSCISRSKTCRKPPGCACNG